MRVGYVTGHDVRQWSKGPSNEVGHMANAYFMAETLRIYGCDVVHLAPPRTPVTMVGRVTESFYKRIRKQRYLQYVEPRFLDALAHHVASSIEQQPVDVVFSNMARYVAHLETPVPMVTWRDATFAGALELHRDFRNVCKRSIARGHAMERAALQRCRLSIFRSEWAARSAIDFYGADPSRVVVVPTGGNADPEWDEAQVRQWISQREPAVCKLLFVGVHWQGKGGPLALDITRALNNAGVPAQLTIVGCTPRVTDPLPSYVVVEGFVDKSTHEGREKLARLGREAHFLLLPTAVDTYGNVFPESNAYGVPCLAPRLAGIPTIIHDGKNGYTFDARAPAEEWVRCIAQHMHDVERYRELATSSFKEFQTRLSWKVAGKRVTELLDEIVGKT